MSKTWWEHSRAEKILRRSAANDHRLPVDLGRRCETSTPDAQRLQNGAKGEDHVGHADRPKEADLNANTIRLATRPRHKTSSESSSIHLPILPSAQNVCKKQHAPTSTRRIPEKESTKPGGGEIGEKSAPRCRDDFSRGGCFSVLKWFKEKPLRFASGIRTKLCQFLNTKPIRRIHVFYLKSLSKDRFCDSNRLGPQQARLASFAILKRYEAHKFFNTQQSVRCKTKQTPAKKETNRLEARKNKKVGLEPTRTKNSTRRNLFILHLINHQRKT